MQTSLNLDDYHCGHDFYKTIINTLNISADMRNVQCNNRLLLLQNIPLEQTLHNKIETL